MPRGRADLQSLADCPSTYDEHLAKRANPQRLSTRAKTDSALKPQITRVFKENFEVYGVRKAWRQLRRMRIVIDRCTMERLMQEMGLHGIIRGKLLRITFSDKAALCPLDRVNRQFQAPASDRLKVSDFTYVSTWSGFAYFAFVIDVYARYIVGWRVSRTAHADFVLDALEQAIHDRRPINSGRLIHHSDRGSQGRFNRPSQHFVLYLSVKILSRTSDGVFHPSVFRGLVLREWATASSSRTV